MIFGDSPARVLEHVADPLGDPKELVAVTAGAPAL
jgi:hypothetical protein